jgi:sulfur carrier protein
MPLTLEINGQSRQFSTLEPGVALSHLIAALDLKGDRVAVEWNGELAPRSAWDATMLAERDRLEIVHFVGGGCGLSCMTRPLLC